MSHNKEKLKTLSHEVVTNLYQLQALISNHKEHLHGSEAQELVWAIGCLKRDMINICERGKLALFSQADSRVARARNVMRTYLKRNDIEQNLTRLDQSVSKCYTKFTVRFGLGC